VVEFVYRRQQALRLAGLALLAAGVGVAIGIDVVAGAVLIAMAALILACVQPLLLAHLRHRRARHVARSNGHGPGVHPDDIDLDGS
jgi:uncharacterized membrane protein YhiD involved in acid resistance